MNGLEVAQSFAARCEQIYSLAELREAFEQAFRRLGFRWFALCSHPQPFNPLRISIAVASYPADWVHHYMDRQYEKIDPIFQFAGRSSRPFLWMDDAFLMSLSSPGEHLMKEAVRAGIEGGYTIPLHYPGVGPASCSLIPNEMPLPAEAYLAAQVIANYGLEIAVRLKRTYGSGMGGVRPRLSLRERQCLALAAQGKSDWVIGQLLGISPRTAHNHVERAKQRLGTATRLQAVIHALYESEIAFGEVLGSHVGNPASDLFSE